jgi:large conductance mechanosensitive channel
MGIWADFKKFVTSGTLVTMAVAFVIGLAIVALITALVDDIIDPLIGAAGGVNFANIGHLTINGSTLMGGAFLSALITFFILLIVVFFLIAEPYQKYMARQPAATKACPACCNQVPTAATRCGFCTSSLPPVTPTPPVPPAGSP